jgi:hypothetical protein
MLGVDMRGDDGQG